MPPRRLFLLALLLSGLSWATPAATEKRLGDGFYEQQLVRDQIIHQQAEKGPGSILTYFFHA